MHKVICSAALAMLLGACPKTSGPATPTPPPSDPDAEAYAHTWLVAEHLRVKGASLPEADANGFHGRTLVIINDGFASPWQPPCEHDAKVEKRTREMSELFSELEIVDGGATKAALFGMTSDILEFRMTCGRGTPLIIWVGGTHAMSCFQGACFMLKRFDEKT